MELNGGLGNMLFQIAAAESLAPAAVRYDFEANFERQALAGRPVHEYERLFSHFSFRANANANFTRSCIVKAPFEHAPLKLVDGALYSGYFQSEKFMNAELVRGLFSWAPSVYQAAAAFGLQDACAMHVRRGDYLTHPTVHPVQSVRYYQQAVERLQPKRIAIFSDDLEWCLTHLRFDVPIELIDVPDHLALAIMSLCSSAVISNSSFSWWGAWLASCPTVAPLRWFGPDGPSDRDIVPSRWVRL